MKLNIKIDVNKQGTRQREAKSDRRNRDEKLVEANRDLPEWLVDSSMNCSKEMARGKQTCSARRLAAVSVSNGTS